jgi:hypothetical protein
MSQKQKKKEKKEEVTKGVILKGFHQMIYPPTHPTKSNK